MTLQWTEDFDMETIPDEVFLSELGRRNSTKRKTFAPGPGRPRSASRCPCGAMTKKRAKQRNHICTTAQ
jgi:hypothetical protein